MTTGITREQFIRNNSHKKFMLIEACEFDKFLDNRFGTGHSPNWIDANTGNSVVIGCRDLNMTKVIFGKVLLNERM